MARHYKKWEDHSPRWQREQTRKGLDKKRWNNWLKLSEKTRKASDPSDYAAGKSIADQAKARKLDAAFKKLIALKPAGRPTAFIRRNVERMTEKDLNWTIKATPDQIRARARQKNIPGYVRNPFWYQPRD